MIYFDCIVGRCRECNLIVAALKLPATPREIREFSGGLVGRGYDVSHATSDDVRNSSWVHADDCPRKPATPPTQRNLFQETADEQA